jgi:hypothetical protein
MLYAGDTHSGMKWHPGKVPTSVRRASKLDPALSLYLYMYNSLLTFISISPLHTRSKHLNVSRTSLVDVLTWILSAEKGREIQIMNAVINH